MLYTNSVMLRLMCAALLAYLAAAERAYDKLLGCQDLGLEDQQFCSVVGGTSGRIKYDPIKWLATRERVVNNSLGQYSEYASSNYIKVAAPDIKIVVNEKAGNIILGKEISIVSDVDVLWCSDIQCSSMLDLVVDKGKNTLSAMLQMQRGSYFGVSAAGRYTNGRAHRLSSRSYSASDSEEVYHYEATEPYSQYYATDALIATNAVMRSLLAANIQGSFGTKVKYAREKNIGNECTRFMYTGNPCTGFPRIEGEKCHTPINTVIILPNNVTNAITAYKDAVERAKLEISKSCTSIFACKFENISSCLSAIPDTCRDDFHRDTKTWSVQMFDSSDKLVGLGTALSLKDNLWSFKTRHDKQRLWLEEKTRLAKNVAYYTSQMQTNGTTYSGIEPFDITSFELLHALRSYTSYCNNRSTDLLGELNYLGTYVNCSYTTNDDTYEGLLGTSSEDRYCVPSDNPKYEYYHSDTLSDAARPQMLYDGMSAFVVADTARCLRMNGSPPVRFCPPEGKQYASQLHTYKTKQLRDKLTNEMASTVATTTAWSYTVVFVATTASILGAAFAFNLSVSADYTSKHATSVEGQDALLSSVNTHKYDKSSYKEKWVSIASTLLLFLSTIATLVIFTLSEYQSERDNTGDGILSLSFKNKVVRSQYITVEAIENDRYDSGFLYMLTETTVIVSSMPLKAIGMVCALIVIVVSFVCSTCGKCHIVSIRDVLRTPQTEEILRRIGETEQELAVLKMSIPNNRSIDLATDAPERARIVP